MTLAASGVQNYSCEFDAQHRLGWVFRVHWQRSTMRAATLRSGMAQGRPGKRKMAAGSSAMCLHSSPAKHGRAFPSYCSKRIARPVAAHCQRCGMCSACIPSAAWRRRHRVQRNTKPEARPISRTTCSTGSHPGITPRAYFMSDWFGGGSDGSSFADSLTSWSVIAAATGFEPVLLRQGSVMTWPGPGPAAMDWVGGGKAGSSFADSLTN